MQASMVTNIQQYLRDYGWTFQPVNDQSLLTGWQGKNGRFPLEININETWIQLRVSPLIHLEFRGKPYAELARFLLQLNVSTRLVKISMERGGDIEISMEVFRHNFDYQQFCRALGILGYYADTIFDEIALHYSKLSRNVIRDSLC